MPEILNILMEKKKNPWSILLIYTKFNFKWVLGLNIKYKIIQHLEEIIKQNLFYEWEKIS